MKSPNLDAAISTLEPSVSIVIPVYNGGESFRRCLASLAEFDHVSMEVIVVVDGGTDDSWKLADEFGAKVIRLPATGGPARARNLGAQAAQGNIVFFIDADVTIHPDTVKGVAQTFCQESDLAALIGSYDDAPGAPNFLAQYRNLFHHYTHQHGSETASTFWGACGAIRREIFLAVGGFDQAYRYPSIEDIELGYRLRRLGHRIKLCKNIQVKHLKQWRAMSMLRADVFYRGIPWTELIWRDRQFVNDLNLKAETRISIVLTYALVIALLGAFWWLGALGIVGLLALILVSINLPVYRFFIQKRGWWFALRVIPWHWLYFFYSGLSFAIGTVRYHLFLKQQTGKTALS